MIASFADRLSAINRYSLAKEAALGHPGRFSKFYDKLYPFALWLRHLYADREDVTCSVHSTASAGMDHDAVVKDGATDPATVIYVQMTTTTFDRHESRLLTDGFAPTSRPVDGSMALSHAERLREAFDKLEQAVSRKSRVSHGPNHVLVVSFEDFMWFGTHDDRAALRSFVSERLAVWHLNVAALYVVGISGRTFESFQVPRR